ncbi:MAG: ABC transporter permease [Proteobacteria bacterium]|nr:ABC transporter permease [Pseudomonadota bacterium]
MPVIFITDAFIFLLVFMVLAFIFYARKHEHLRAPWRDVTRRPIAMSAAVILGVYISIGLLDSFHFHPQLESQETEETVYSTKISSVLDVILNSLRENTERTYSAPLASYAFAKEMIEHEDGTQSRDYPRLEYAGVHLEDPETEQNKDIIIRILVGILIGLLSSALISGLIIFILARRLKMTIKAVTTKCVKDDLDIPWYSILLTISLLIIVSSIMFSLASHYHVFGTDKVGQDVLYQTLKSIRTGLVIGTLTTLVMLPFAIMMGLMAGFFRGWIDDVIQYLYTTLSSIPGVLLIAASILLLQVYIANHEADFTSPEQRADLRLLFLCIILGITSWTGLCRLLRAETLKLREADYVQAARAFGVGNLSIMLRHLLPNVMHIVMISIVLDFSGLVLAEAVLSYINIGVDPSMNSWGNMINSARLEMAREPVVWWSLAAAFIFMFVLVLAANLFSDAVRDAFDPRLRQL